MCLKFSKTTLIWNGGSMFLPSSLPPLVFLSPFSLAEWGLLHSTLIWPLQILKSFLFSANNLQSMLYQQMCVLFPLLMLTHFWRLIAMD